MNTDSKGNKLPETEITKSTKSLNVRHKRLNAISACINKNAKFCPECGYKRRSVNHDAGIHHKQGSKS